MIDRTPRQLRFRAGQRREGSPAVTYEVIHGYRRAFIDVGSGPALLLIHGIGDCSDTWRTVIEPLSERYRVIAPDLLGHGRSDKPRADYSVGGFANGMRDLLSVLDVERATVVGHSLGGGVAAQFAYQYPDRCERLVLVSSGGVGRSVSPLLRLAASPGAGLLMPFFGLPPVKLSSRIVGEFLERYSGTLGRDVDEILAVFDSLPNTGSRRALLRTLRSAVDWRGQHITLMDRAYLVAGLPTLIIWGEDDAIIPVGHARAAQAALSGSRLEIFEKVGHFPHHGAPNHFNELLTHFISGTKPARFNRGEWSDRLRSRGLPPLGEPSENGLVPTAIS